MAKETVLLDIQIDEGESVQSINTLRASVRELTKARNASNLQTVEGRASVTSLNAAIEKNSLIIKSNVDALTKQKMNVGNYTDSILAAVPGMGKFKGGITGVNAAMKANPIGLVITALLALKEIFMGNAVVADNLSFIFSAFSKALGFYIDKVVSTVTSLDNLTAALMNPIKFFKDLAGGVANAAVEGFNASKAMDAFGLAQATANQEIALAQINIDALTKSLKDRTKTEKERIGIANEIADQEIRQSERRAKIFQSELENERLKMKGRTLSGEEETKLKVMETAVMVAESEKQVIQSAKQTRINILLDKEQSSGKVEQIKLASEADTDAHNLRMEQMRIRLALEEENALKKVNLLTFLNDEFQAINLEEIDKFLNDEQAKSDKEYAILVAADARKLALEEAFKVQKMNILSSAAGQISAIVGKQTAEGKALGILQASIDTYAGASAQLKLPFPFNLIAVGTTIATGLVNVSKIAGFAQGGRINSGFGVPISRSNGDNILATVKTGEVILNERQQSALGGASTFRSIGVPGFADGGIVGFPSSALPVQSNGQFDINRLSEIIASQKIFVAVEDINTGQGNLASVVNRATF